MIHFGHSRRAATFARSSIVACTFPLAALAALSGCSSSSSSAATPVDTGDGGDGSTPYVAPPPKDEWTWRGGPLDGTFNNVAESKITVANAATLKQAWVFNGKSQTNGIAVIVDDTEYVATQSELVALDHNGTELWSNADARALSGPAYKDGILYVNNASSHLVAVNAMDGTTIFNVPIENHKNAQGVGSPTVFESTVVVGSSSAEEAYVSANATFRGSLVAFDATTGAEKWRHYTVEAPDNGASIWSSPAIDPVTRTVFAATGNNYTENATDTSDSIFAVSFDDGSLKWNTQVSSGDVFTILNAKSPDSDFGADPFLFDATIDGATVHLVGAGQKSGVFTAMNREDGSIVWSVPVSRGSALIGGMLNNGAFDGKHVLLAGNNGTSSGPGSEPKNGESPGLGTSRLVALDPATGDVVWERQLPAWVWSPITVANGVGFVAYETRLQAFDVETGTKLVEFPPAKGTIASGVAIAQGRACYGSGITYSHGIPDNVYHCLMLP